MQNGKDLEGKEMSLTALKWKTSAPEATDCEISDVYSIPGSVLSGDSHVTINTLCPNTYENVCCSTLGNCRGKNWKHKYLSIRE